MARSYMVEGEGLLLRDIRRARLCGIRRKRPSSSKEAGGYCLPTFERL